MPKLDVTAVSITDAQIYKLREQLRADPQFGFSTQVQADIWVCDNALEYAQKHWIRDARSERIRGLCADILNRCTQGI